MTRKRGEENRMERSERERDSTWLLNNWGVSRKKEWLREVSSLGEPFTTIRNKVRGANVRKRRQSGQRLFITQGTSALLPGLLHEYGDCPSLSTVAMTGGKEVRLLEKGHPVTVESQTNSNFFQNMYVLHGLPRWLSGKESTCPCRRCGLNPWVGKIPWRRK